MDFRRLDRQFEMQDYSFWNLEYIKREGCIYKSRDQDQLGWRKYWLSSEWGGRRGMVEEGRGKKGIRGKYKLVISLDWQLAVSGC
jgi:hypothetical protein